MSDEEFNDQENVKIEDENEIEVKCQEEEVDDIVIPKPKVYKSPALSPRGDDDETLGSESMSEDDESIGSIAEFLAPDDVASPARSPAVVDLKDETQTLVEEAKSFLGGSTELENVKIKNGRVLRANPKSTENQRKYWTRRIVYLQCIDDINSKIWKVRGKELGIFNLKEKMPEKVDNDGLISDEKWESFIEWYNDLKDKLFEDEEDDDDDDDVEDDEDELEEGEDDDEDDEDEDDEDDSDDSEETDDDDDESGSSDDDMAEDGKSLEDEEDEEDDEDDEDEDDEEFEDDEPAEIKKENKNKRLKKTLDSAPKEDTSGTR
jgi:hypothetical protein